MQPGFLPINFYLCFSEEVWKKEIEKLGADQNSPFIPDTAAACCYCFDEGQPDGNFQYSIYINITPGDDAAQAARIAHEAVHAWEHVLESMGVEDSVDSEFQAYFVQWVVEVGMYESIKRHEHG